MRFDFWSLQILTGAALPLVAALYVLVRNNDRQARQVAALYESLRSHEVQLQLLFFRIRILQATVQVVEEELAAQRSGRIRAAAGSDGVSLLLGDVIEEAAPASAAEPTALGPADPGVSGGCEGGVKEDKGEGFLLTPR